MSNRLQIQTKTASQPSFIPVQTGLLQRKCACGQHTVTGGECEECRQKREGVLQRAAVSAEPVNGVPPIVHEVLGSPGQPLDGGTRAFMEPRFGRDFSQVRVHTDARAAESARVVNALAYTVGKDVVFGMGQYEPGTSEGRRLLAHELTHVVQQGGLVPGVLNGIGSPTSTNEEEAASIAERLKENVLYQSQASAVVSSHSQGTLQRKDGASAPASAPGTSTADITQAPSDLSCIRTTEKGHLPGVDIFFDHASSTIKDVFHTSISAFASSWVASSSRSDMRVDGYASTEGSASFNWVLSCDRAEKVRDELARQHIPRSKIKTFAHGASDEFSKTSLPPNRRVIISTISEPSPVPPQPTTPEAGPTTPQPSPPETKKVPNSFEVGTTSPGHVPPTGPATPPKGTVTPIASQNVTLTLSSSQLPTSSSVVEVTTEVNANMKLFSTGDTPDPTRADPCRLGEVEMKVNGKLKLDGVGVGDRVHLFYHEPTFSVTLPGTCRQLPEIKAEVDFLNVEIIPKVLESSMKPGLTFGDNQLKPGVSIEVQLKPFGRKNNFLSHIKITGEIETTSEKKAGSAGRDMKSEGKIGVGIEF